MIMLTRDRLGDVVTNLGLENSRIRFISSCVKGLISIGLISTGVMSVGVISIGVINWAHTNWTHINWYNLLQFFILHQLIMTSFDFLSP